MKRIALDMDGVLADVAAQFIRFHENETGELKTPDQIAGLSEIQAFPYARKHVFAPGFFRTAPLLPHSREVVKKLSEEYEIFIVTAATEFPQSLAEKQAWLGEFFPFIGWKQMVFCGNKSIINADIMIDDHYRNLDQFPGFTILFDQHHNRHRENGRHRRVFNWKEIEQLLL